MADNKLIKIAVIVGPTASGKSDLALRLAKLAQGKPFKKKGVLGAEIISADSRQVYRGMDIGTGKVLRDKTFPVPNLKFKNPRKGQWPSGLYWQNSKFRDFYSAGIRHHLINVSSPRKQFTADDFKKLGEKAIRDIAARDKIPIIVGGTGFYIDILLGRINMAQVPPNITLRKHFDKLSVEHLFKMLRKLDPQRAKIIDPYNKRRLVRALEVVLTTKKPSSAIKYPLPNSNYNILWLGINPGKEKLAKNIKNRLEKRLEQGMINEVKNLISPPTGGGLSYKRLERFGLEYKWLSLYLQNKISYKNMEKNLCRDITHYSKRQMTWFKKNKKIRWIKDAKTAEHLIQRFLD